jgi:hypothetical protein
MFIADFEVFVVIIYDNYLFINLIFKNFKKKNFYVLKEIFYFKGKENKIK